MLKYFKLQELVSSSVYQRFGENSWMFLDPTTLAGLDILVDVMTAEFGGRVYIIINNWESGGTFQHSGLRTWEELQVVYKGAKKIPLSLHLFGKAFDIKCYFKGHYLDSKTVEKAILKNWGELHPYFSTIEEDPKGWNHLDNRYLPSIDTSKVPYKVPLL